MQWQQQKQNINWTGNQQPKLASAKKAKKDGESSSSSSDSD